MALNMREPFVVVAGSPRSGTSLLRTILRSSSALVVHKTEPHYVLELYRQYGRTVTDVEQATAFLLGHDKFPVNDITPDSLQQAFNGQKTLALSEVLRTCFRLLRGATPEKPLVLKHPAFILHLDLIKELFPDLTVIHLVRDPRANVLSQRTRWPSTNLWDASTKWRNSVRSGRDWQQRAVTPYLEVRYEDLVTTPEPTCRTICDFLQIPFEPSLLAFDHVEREWNPTNPGEGKARHYQGFEQQRIDKWKRHLRAEEVKLVEDRCRQGMEWFGYERMEPVVQLATYLPYYLNERRRAIRKSIKRLKRRFDAEPAAPGRDHV